VIQLDIARLRLNNQRLNGRPFEKPEEMVGWFGAVQAQDYAGAKWGVAQRTAGAVSADLDRLFDEGKFLRTHVMRPTWHFVMPVDIRWILGLTAPRVHAASAYYYRQLELDEALFKRSNALLAGALAGGKQLTRTELAAALQAGGIPAKGLRMGYLLMHAELDAVICSGARRGKQFTYALLEERVPEAPEFEHSDALAELTRRYFRSHGPATVQDYAWWSGLTITEAKAGIEMLNSGLDSAAMNGKTYWFAEPSTGAEVRNPTVHLLPNYDEHLVAYKDHAPSFDPVLFQKLAPEESSLMAHIITLNGLVIGGWQRRVERKMVTIKTSLLVKLDPDAEAALMKTVEGYGRFMGSPVSVLSDQAGHQT
jgi:hypothetical protein